MKFDAFCGTYNAAYIEIDTDLYGTVKPTGADDDEREHAMKLLMKTMDDETFADDHERNEDAVNGCIALHVLGYDALAWFENFVEDMKANHSKLWFLSDLDKFIEHVQRVSAYLDKWGPDGKEGRALDFAI